MSIGGASTPFSFADEFSSLSPRSQAFLIALMHDLHRREAVRSAASSVVPALDVSAPESLAIGGRVRVSPHLRLVIRLWGLALVGTIPLC